jgi:pantetheine-phosphate adenylyltransferase
MSERRAVYPGSFDPITNGHLDIIHRALTVFDHVIVAVAYNQDKQTGLFTPGERVEMIREVADEQQLDGRVSMDSFHGLLVDYARRVGASTIIRGLRAVADFEYEFQMTLMNRHLAVDVETVFFMADEAHFFTSSRLVKEIVSFGGNMSEMVPASVYRRLRKKLSA